MTMTAPSPAQVSANMMQMMESGGFFQTEAELHPLQDEHDHRLGKPCYPCIERLERECGITDALP